MERSSRLHRNSVFRWGPTLSVCHPTATGLPYFELAGENEILEVGARVIVVVADTGTKEVTGVSGSIRGIGPDNFELDANLESHMSGAPVLDVNSGKVIGIVAPQVAGVAEEWAVGTRHQDSRNFAARLDQINVWKTSDRGRFAKEAAYIERINEKTRLAWLAHMLLEVEVDLAMMQRDAKGRPSPVPGQTDEGSQDRRVRFWASPRRNEEMDRLRKLKESLMNDAKKNASTPHLRAMINWINDFAVAKDDARRYELNARLPNIYRLIGTDLQKEETDLSAHLTEYHQQQYRKAMRWRSDGLGVILKHANSVGRVGSAKPATFSHGCHYMSITPPGPFKVGGPVRCSA